jgi:hypothetical protein
MKMLLLLCVAAQRRREGYSWGGVTRQFEYLAGI